ncbi:SpdD protein [Streptomyces europaeiscabiei]|uniref:SpdD protein n=1 Tax=Streptomyces europaeiscabiei TaxID=146819 RepID=A0ABU4NS26_9ACTN|nr:SpdD protein [Streptomyces europaeiscabiei]MDX3548811.1 SpdD protein [Streptomyces europaeiscabiei]MDX3555135.1 SpdD protein [Streptomyces europaeiscabiei]MDX3705149.1 SpdD protein [Streptomyces europaeiscabiei]
MFTPKYPPQDTAPLPTTTTPTAMSPATHVPAPAPVPSASVFGRPTVQLTPGSTLALATAGGAMVLVVGAVLVSMLLAVAITAASVAVCAVVVRSILKSDRR